jgi:hypothetical protein
VALAFAHRPAGWLDHRCLRGLPVLVHEVSRRVWGLRLRRTKQELALSRLFTLPSAHYKGVGVRIVVYEAEYPPRLSSVYASLCTSRYPVQDSRPSRSLLLSRKELSSSASCRFSPAHRNRLAATSAIHVERLGIRYRRRAVAVDRLPFVLVMRQRCATQPGLCGAGSAL